MRGFLLLSGQPKRLRSLCTVCRIFPSLRGLLLLSGVPKRLRSLCTVWSDFPQFAQVVVIVGSTEKAAFSLYSLVGISAVCTGCSYCREYRECFSCSCSLVGIPHFAQLVAFVKNAEQTLLVICSLIRVSVP